MKFTVATANGMITNYDGQYSITESGLLSIEPVNGNPVVLSPAGWFALEVVSPA